MSQPLLNVQNIKVSFGNKEVIHGVSFDVMPGEVVTLIGSNGAGKSTVLKAIYGLVPLQEGNIFFDGEEITGLETCNLLKKGIVYIRQKNNLFENMTVYENLEMAASIYLNKESTGKIANVLEKYTVLQKYLNKKIDALSGGQRQMVALAMGLIHEPKLVMFDEPTAGLDIKRIHEIFSIIEDIRYSKKISFLIVEHRVNETKKITDHWIGMKLGEKMPEITTLDESVLKEIFF